MMPYSGYNRPTRRSTLGFYGASMYRVV